ncbi:uncharacterized protein LOC128322256 isoform X1 [Hemicordylus capensis]|uniref:uncharacterized protein LOC128322256 isoform X1 n=1 Tax=Hemicordylus capensis TaxID=884348 RepID=UPI00230269FF|nr:uncharacterized protein LOC128322256 isoform X1 [Hemicordylus capensis]
MATPGATERSFCEEPDKLPPRKRSKPHRMPLPFACCGGEGVCPSQAPQEAPKAPDWPIQFWGRGFGPFWVFPAPALQFGPSIPGGRSSFIELLLGLNQSGRGAGSARGSDEWRILAGSIELPSDGFPRHQRPAGASDCGWSAYWVAYLGGTGGCSEWWHLFGALLLPAVGWGCWLALGLLAFFVALFASVGFFRGLEWGSLRRAVSGSLGALLSTRIVFFCPWGFLGCFWLHWGVGYSGPLQLTHMPRKAKEKTVGRPIKQPKRPAPPPSSSDEDDEEMVLIRGLINRMEALEKAKASILLEARGLAHLERRRKFLDAHVVLLEHSYENLSLTGLELLKRARAHPAQCCLQSQLILYCQCLAFPFLQCLLLRFQNPRCHRIPPCGSIFVSAPGCWRSGGSCSGPGLRPFVGLWSLQEGQLLPLGHPVGFWKACFSFLVG